MRRRRNERRLSLLKAAAALTIPQRYLQAIESGDFQRIPLGYRRLYLRDYARWLGIDEKHALALFRRDYPGAKAASRSFLPPRKNCLIRRLFTNWQFVSITAFILLIIGYLGLEYYLFQRPPDLTLLPLPKKVHSPFIMVKGQAHRAITLKLNNRLLLLDEDGNFKRKVILMKGENWLYFEAVSPSGKKMVLKKEIVFQPQVDTIK